jgi:hypothetical protein
MAYPSNTNKRVFYATQAVAVGDMGGTGVIDSVGQNNTINGSGKLMIAHGLQSIGVNTNFNLEQIFELGQLSLYENYEEVPEIEVSFEKVLDGYTLMYHAGTVRSTSPTLTGRGSARADVRMAVGFDTRDYMATGVGTEGNSGVAELYCSGMYISSVSYNLGTDGNFTESTTFVGNDKQWFTGSDAGGVLADANGQLNDALGTGVFGSDSPVGVGNSVLRRQNVIIGSSGRSYGGATFKTEIPNIIEGGSSGSLTNSKNIIEGSGPYLQSLSISCDLGRENIQQLGKKAPYYRYVSFPVDVTCDIEVTATAGDNVDAYEEGRPSAGDGIAAGKNLKDHSIQIVLDDSTVFQLGKKNKLTSITYGGGDAGGGNATISYSFTNSNDFVVLHSGDPIALTKSTSNYWKNHFA